MANTSHPVRVLVVNENSFELSLLSASLRLHGLNIIGEASSMLVAENLFRAQEPDVVLVDLQHSGEEAIFAMQRLRNIDPGLGLILLTACPDLRLFGLDADSLPTGSCAILKGSVSEIATIATALDHCLSLAQTDKAMQWIDSNGSLSEESFQSILSEFTDIQIETLRLVSIGLSNSEIARVRFVSEKSVEQIVARIAHHLGIVPDRRRNLRVLLTAEYFSWLGAVKSRHVERTHPR
jgi:DNA-binding NarL/FixJ family response regulator